ncbi:hypothetical protein [Marinomonas algicola]|uniref:hypothetical protein n=1 Tax=Marinomonas algicola TaxID=2773454 RepID=UPI00174DB0D5|nr:hypothetical protein [Marinomonas algicola]
MSNHLHIVRHVDEKQAKNWSSHEVLRRWHALHKGTLFTQQYSRGDTMPDYVLELAERSEDACRGALCLLFELEDFMLFLIYKIGCPALVTTYDWRVTL